MRQHKFRPDKQYNNARSFPVYIVAIEEVENYYVSNMVNLEYVAT